ncbi:von Willebrand factor precursor [Xenopus tropicalis]|uniref:von Willebrand factor n=1 Tax=Xenopus tropicalis TaxID=8364 RepID=F5XVC3_XENTR|nr:von Willebrand factor precursor [Xenopus tropicalis]DAA34812.1 TPA_inf: von Willebrand factor [Xenopus tropicalis]|eukprot:NP_001243217.1 von Willebrand factor precursor [Xenopus tropicalis]
MKHLLFLALGLIYKFTTGPLVAEGKLDWSVLARCSLFGENHIQTFDGTFYDFYGDCSYMLAGDCNKHSFSLLADYRNGKKKSVSLYLGEYFDIHLFLDGTATQGEKHISMPYASNGIFLESEAGYYKLSSQEHGFMVKIDASGNVQVVLPSKHFNKTCGLCGNYNQFAEDDFMMQEGILTENSYDFANSWALHGGARRCRRTYPPSNTCNISSETAEKDFMQRCQMLKTSSAFMQCHHLVDPDPYIAICEDDMCECAEELNCPCQTFLEYARTCAQHGVITSNWPTHTICKPLCPFGMEYNECVSPCVKTCQSLNINEVCQEQCIDGCSCPDGKVLDGDRCIPVFECSCIHSGKRYPPGSAIRRDCNSCTCQNGAWECSNEDCPGECFVTGQSHFKSFDNKHFTFSGICQYLLATDAMDSTFSVTIETVQCADDIDAVCTRSASLRLLDMHNITIKLKHGGGVSLDGQDILLPLVQGFLRIQTTVLSAVRLTYKEDLQVDWDGHGKLLIKLSPIYSGLISGLCGNYNGNQGDDFLTPSGLIETSVEDFGNSWKLNGDCTDLMKQDTDPCNLNPKRARFSEEVCFALMDSAFQSCHNEVNPAPYLKNCRYDVCSCSNGKECLCSALSTYAAACSRKGILIDWRTPEFCPIQCSEGKIYQQCGSPCNQTCRSLSHPDVDCREFCMEGCYCPPGLYTNEDGECVPKSDCSCYYDGELFQPDDVFSNHYSMCYCENGLMHCSTSDVPSGYFPESFFNQPPARVKRSLDCRPPLNKIICPADNPKATGIECAKTCQNYELECVSHGCISGCTCPDGMVRHKSKCMFPQRCPCFHAGKEYAPGSSVEIDCNTCVCENRKWKCTENICDATCSAIGVSHYLTFDGFRYKFPGDCQYVLAQDYCGGVTGTFRILVGNEGCGFSGEKCTKRITILFRNGEIELTNEQIHIKKPLSDETSFDVLKSGNYFILLLGNQMSVTWDKGMRVYVTLKETYRDKVCGLCGNFDGIENNDLISSNNQIEMDPVNFGNSWKVNPLCADAAKFGAVSPLSLCKDNLMKQMAAENACNILMGDLFAECAKVVNPEPYWEICTYDTCTCESAGDCACFCDSLAAYAHVCAQRGINVHWRSSHLCPQSCEEKNQRDLDYVCEWRYNSCTTACPVTCQHPEPVNCPLKCVEGCQAYCPPGKILDEVSESCIEPKDCPVCTIEGHTVPHGRKIILNHDDPQRCQLCHCEGKNLQCNACEISVITTVAPTTLPVDITPTTEVVDTSIYECNKMMDLVFLVDGSSKLSMEEFEVVKDFIVGIMEKIHISQKKIRVSVVHYYSATTDRSFGLKDNKKLSELVKMVKSMKYVGSLTSSAPEALKYASHYVFGEAPRDNAPKFAMLLTASKSPKSVAGIMKAIHKRKITVIPVGLGPDINMEEINIIQKMSPKNKPYIFGSVYELLDRRDEIIHYLCDLVPEPPKPTIPSTKKPTVTEKPVQKVTIAPVEKGPTATQIPEVKPTTQASWDKTIDLVFIIEGSDKVGEINFNKTKIFLEKMIQKLQISEETIHITIIQFSFTVTIEYSFSEKQTKEDIIQRIRKMEYRGGNATNTGKAINYVTEHTFTTDTGSRNDIPHLVYMVTSNPATDIITKGPSDINMVPIAVGPNVDIQELELIANSRDEIILIEDYDVLISDAPVLVLEKCCSRKSLSTTPFPPTTTPATQPITDNCEKPMDVIFVLDGSSSVRASQFEEMKTFVKAFIKKVNIGVGATQVSVLQYGWRNILEIAWTDPQEKESLLKAVDNIQKAEDGPAKIGEALLFGVRTAMSEVHGARPGSTKIAVIVITDVSVDQVAEAANSAVINRVSVFPIGIGTRYDSQQLKVLAGPSANKKITKLQIIEDLPTMVTLSNEFINKICTEFATVCIDEEGKQRKPGDKWMLTDKCHSVTCLPDGKTLLESHKVNCEKIPKPMCHNNLPAMKIEETCGCRWTCPCMCMGSSTRHIVTFDGLDFKLMGACSYVLFHDEVHDVKVILHNAECNTTNHQTCMKSVEVKHNKYSILLSSNMQVSVNGDIVPLPYANDNFEVTLYGEIVHEVKIPQLGFVFTFTPANNEFVLQLNPAAFSLRTSGLCGICDQNTVNDFTLSDGSVTTDSSKFIKEWTVVDSLGRTCETKPDKACTQPISSECKIMLSKTFEACHTIFPPKPYFTVCEEASCHGQDICEVIAAYVHVCRINGVCINWRTPDFCPMECPRLMVYHHCHMGCNKECGKTLNGTLCSDSSTEGCFCPEGDVTVNGKCVNEKVCSQCTDRYGEEHQLLETWIPTNAPCSICMCLENRMINCTAMPCPTVKPLTCGPCEIPRLKKTSEQCCPDYECVCDLTTCDVNPVPHCENGLVPVLTNPGHCKPNYECACRIEECPNHKNLICPPYKQLALQKTACCDKYECVCSCTNSTVVCPTGYSSSIATNDCDCTSVTCIPDKVCLYNNDIHLAGSMWEDGCRSCTCTDKKDSVTGLLIAECLQQRCNTNCGQGFTYVKKAEECCGKCKKTVCEQKISPRGQGDIDFSGETTRWYNVGAMWNSPTDPCIINECAQVNDEVFILQKNVSCSEISTSKCPSGYELICMQGTECCPICQCEPIPGCRYNGSIIAPNTGIMIDECSSCECTTPRGLILSYKLTCKKRTCPSCPKNFILKKEEGSCCGQCIQTSCSVKLKNGTIIYVKPNETVRDGCDSHSCKINNLGELTREKRITSCPPFNREKCLTDGGKIKELDDSCCETCVEPECKQVTGIITYVRVDDCTSDRQLNLHYCEGKCTSKSSYDIETHSMKEQCICCSATHTEPMKVPLRCANGTMIEHEVLQARSCECMSHKCTQ